MVLKRNIPFQDFQPAVCQTQTPGENPAGSANIDSVDFGVDNHQKSA